MFNILYDYWIKASSKLKSEEWTNIKELCNVLKLFEKVTKSVSREQFISVSIVIVLTKGLVNVYNKMPKMNSSV